MNRAVHFVVLSLVTIALCMNMFGVDAVQAHQDCNCGDTEAAINTECLTGNKVVVWCDDFEDGDWGQTVGDASDPVNDGWNLTPQGPWCSRNGYGGSGCPAGFPSSNDPVNGISAVGDGLGGGSYRAARSGPHSGQGQAEYMGDHTLMGTTNQTNGYRRIFFRYYIHRELGYDEATQKHLTGNGCCAGVGGIKFWNVNNTGPQSGTSPLPPVGTEIRREFVTVPGGAGNKAINNITNWNNESGKWFYHEYEFDLGTAGQTNGVIRFWRADCGATGTTCGTPTLHGEQTGVAFPSNSDTIGSLWLENWAGGSGSVGVERYDQIVVVQASYCPGKASTDPCIGLASLVAAPVTKHRIQGGMRLTGTWRVQ